MKQLLIMPMFVLNNSDKSIRHLSAMINVAIHLNYAERLIRTKICENVGLKWNSRRLIYYIKCPTCEDKYIDRTGNSLSERTRMHQQHVSYVHVRQILLRTHFESSCYEKEYSEDFYSILFLTHMKLKKKKKRVQISSKWH